MDTYIEDSKNEADYTNAKNLDLELANKQTGKEQFAVVKQVLESYPQANSRVEKMVRNSAGTTVSITIVRFLHGNVRICCHGSESYEYL